jgi:glycosyltransferase involved in cell wall biosynthesis
MAAYFTVIISTYNRAASLEKTLRSIMVQTDNDFELIIGDDASSDNTQEIVSSFTYKQVTYYRNDENSGLSFTRNRGLKLAKGDFVLLIDDDTELDPDFLRRLKVRITSSEADAYCPRIFKADLKVPYLGIFASERERELSYFDFNYFIGLVHVLRNNIIKKIGYYDERFGIGSRYYAAEETDLFFRIKRAGGRFIYCPELVVYHPLGKEVSKQKAFLYSYGVAASLTKNMICDTRHRFVYIYIIMHRAAVGLFRALEVLIFPGRIREKDRIYRYSSLFFGTIRGFCGYLIGLLKT